MRERGITYRSPQKTTGPPPPTPLDRPSQRYHPPPPTPMPPLHLRPRFPGLRLRTPSTTSSTHLLPPYPPFKPTTTTPPLQPPRHHTASNPKPQSLTSRNPNSTPPQKTLYPLNANIQTPHPGFQRPAAYPPRRVRCQRVERQWCGEAGGKGRMVGR